MLRVRFAHRSAPSGWNLFLDGNGMKHPGRASQSPYRRLLRSALALRRWDDPSGRAWVSDDIHCDLVVLAHGVDDGEDRGEGARFVAVRDLGGWTPLLPAESFRRRSRVATWRWNGESPCWRWW